MQTFSCRQDLSRGALSVGQRIFHQLAPMDRSEFFQGSLQLIQLIYQLAVSFLDPAIIRFRKASGQPTTVTVLESIHDAGNPVLACMPQVRR